MGDRIFNMSQGSTYIEKQINYVQGNQVFGKPLRAASNDNTPQSEVDGMKSGFRKYIYDPSIADRLIAWLHSVMDPISSDQPKNKWRPLRAAIYANFIDPKLPHKIAVAEFGKVNQQTYSKHVGANTDYTDTELENAISGFKSSSI